MFWIIVIVIALMIIKDSTGSGNGSHFDARNMNKIMLFDMTRKNFDSFIKGK